MELLDRDVQLEAREVGAETAVRSAAERDVPVAPAVEADFVGGLELGRVDVARADEQRRGVAGPAHDAADLDVLDDLARHHHHRRLVAEQLLDRDRDQRGIVEDRLTPFGVPREVRDHAVECGGDGVEATEHQEVTRPEQLGVRQRVTFDLGPHEHAQQAAVVWSVVPLRELAFEVRGDVAAGRLADLLGFFHRVRDRSDRVVAPFQEPRQVRLRESHQRDEERGGQRRGEVLVEVALTAIDEPVDDLVDELAHLGLELGHLPRRELRVEQPAVLRVVGRVDRQRDQRHFVADLDDVLRREHLGVLERPHDVFVARDPHAVAEHARRARDRALGVHLLVGGDRVVRGRDVEDAVDRARSRTGDGLLGVAHGTCSSSGTG